MNDNKANVAKSGDLTTLLTRARSGDPQAAPRFVEAVYPELRRLAQMYMRRERGGHTLQPTALINEAYLRLFNDQPLEWNDRAHFIATAARVMRSVLVDHARRHCADKRGGGWAALELKEGLVYSPEKADILLDLEDALQRLEGADPEKARVVELRVFGGLQVEQIAALTGTSDRTVKRQWAAAKARLKRDLSKSHRS
jgi:RNA polymerase sigma-70 factor, ECF subfamily